LSCFSLFKLLKTPAKFLSVTKLSHDFLGVYREEIILGKDSCKKDSCKKDISQLLVGAY